ncbi:MAG: hypothetical protein AAB840_03140 [Patescibacteria group bacterium]
MFDTLSFIGTTLGTILGVLYVSSPIWLPILLVGFFWSLWFDYIKRKGIASREYILLEIRIPKEIKKSPAAMEVVFGAMTGSEGNWFKKYWKGETRAWYSLEIISIGGAIHFFIWLDKKSKNLLESQIYSQYPGVEIYEVEDYTNGIFYDPEVNSLWGTEMILTQPDPFPIKTYVDYGVAIDKDDSIDPMSITLEYLGTLQEGQQAWIQIMVRSQVKENDKDAWKEEAKKQIEKILEGAKLKGAGDDPKTPKVASLSEDQKEQIKALEKSTNKPGFQTGIRLVLFTDKDKFDATQIGGLLNTFKQYGSSNLNGFKPNNTTSVKFPWYDIWGKKVNKKKRNILDAYKRRSYFHPPYKEKPFVLNTEELATIYHFPGRVVATPTIGRIASKKAEPPANLPI